MEREETDLDAESCHEECERCKHNPALIEVWQEALHVSHVQRACDRVEVADPEQDERCCDGTHDQVVEACNDAVSAVTHSNERVSSE